MMCAAKKYAAFLASESVIKQIPRLLGPGLNKAGKFPTLVTHNDKLEEKVRPCLGAVESWCHIPEVCECRIKRLSSSCGCILGPEPSVREVPRGYLELLLYVNCVRYMLCSPLAAA